MKDKKTSLPAASQRGCPPLQHGVSPRVLVAEDCPIGAASAKEILSSHGYEVSVVGNGNDALKTLAREDFDFVLMDIEMPGLDGFETCRRLCALRPDASFPPLPIIGMSAYTSALLRKIALKIGMHSLLEKPLDFDQLLNILRSFEGGPVYDSGAADYADTNATPPVFAREAAVERLGGAHTLFCKMLRKLHQTLPEKVEKIDSAVARTDLETVAITSHNLAGSLGAVGAQRSMLQARELYRVARAGDVQAVRTGCRTLAEQLTELLPQIKKELDEPERRP